MKSDLIQNLLIKIAIIILLGGCQEKKNKDYIELPKIKTREEMIIDTLVNLKTEEERNVFRKKYLVEIMRAFGPGTGCGSLFYVLFDCHQDTLIKEIELLAVNDFKVSNKNTELIYKSQIGRPYYFLQIKDICIILVSFTEDYAETHLYFESYFDLQNRIWLDNKWLRRNKISKTKREKIIKLVRTTLLNKLSCKDTLIETETVSNSDHLHFKEEL